MSNPVPMRPLWSKEACAQQSARRQLRDLLETLIRGKDQP